MKAILSITLLIFMSFTFDTPELSGQWSGELLVQGNALKLVFHIKRSDDGYLASFDSPSQNVKDIPVSNILFDYPDIRLESSGVGMVFEGKLEGDNIKGKWMQSGQTFDLVLTRDVVTEK